MILSSTSRRVERGGSGEDLGISFAFGGQKFLMTSLSQTLLIQARTI